MLQKELYFAAMGTGFTCLATVLGAAMVFFFRKEMRPVTQKIFLGFAAGVMIAASVWSLLIPAMEMAEAAGQNVLLHVGGGFLLGGAFLMLLDVLLPHLHMGSNEAEGLPSHWRRTTMIVLAVTLHNIPEGMAVGLAFSVAAQDAGSLSGALALALGMGLQNFPEGAAVSLPLKSQGVSGPKSFACGAASGVVEPIFGILTVLIASSITGIMPVILSFAAGAMLYVVVEELIPEAHLGEHSHSGTVSVMAGFLVMMLLDVMLG
ncbi:ZIP family metal transporter [Oscillibacter sp. MSJ-2]|uniref:ZIP family metal transporter n=1 Tax=Dysosmobacter acutus TaxID=2841504 RepID=A0ABS6F8C8_9FIRM|nr:ZIP family metal transporter [Dysosmobacter acutus]MBU5625615.1 ZIP family metal transporter [Dysosmobacter acutus]